MKLVKDWINYFNKYTYKIKYLLNTMNNKSRNKLIQKIVL